MYQFFIVTITNSIIRPIGISLIGTGICTKASIEEPKQLLS